MEGGGRIDGGVGGGGLGRAGFSRSSGREVGGQERRRKDLLRGKRRVREELCFVEVER